MKLLYPQKVIENLTIFANRNYKLVFTNGCFDILHSGHISSLLFSKSKGDKLLVALNSDSSIKKIKGDERPIVPQIHRINVLCALEMIDYVIVFDEETPVNLIEKIKPDVLVKGYDYKNKYIAGSEFVEQIEYAPFEENYSTTNIINKFR